MSDLRVLFEKLGFRDVRTLLNSGNVIFSAPDQGRAELVASIGKGLAAELGLTSPVIVLSGEEVAAAVRNNPLSYDATNPSRFLVVVLRKRADQKRLRPLQGTVDAGGAGAGKPGCISLVLKRGREEPALGGSGADA